MRGGGGFAMDVAVTVAACTVDLIINRKRCGSSTRARFPVVHDTEAGAS